MGMTRLALVEFSKERGMSFITTVSGPENHPKCLHGAGVKLHENVME
jgi:hypothetical protein